MGDRSAMVRASATPQAPKPLELGAKLLCKWRDQNVKACEVIERKQSEDTGEWQYYVHYEGLMTAPTSPGLRLITTSGP